MWYEVLRKRERGMFIGTLVLRHSAHHASLLERGWETVPIDEIAAPAAGGYRSSRSADVDRRVDRDLS